MWLKKLFYRSSPETVASASATKEIVYRGGLLTFSIPSHWIEFYEEDGGGLFYADEPDSGTLRLNVMTFSAPDESATIDINTEAEWKAAATDGASSNLDNGNSIVSYNTETTESGVEICLRFWELYNAVPPRHMRIAIFSYTLLRNQTKQQRFVQEMELLDGQFRNAIFATEIGL